MTKSKDEKYYILIGYGCTPRDPDAYLYEGNEEGLREYIQNHKSEDGSEISGFSVRDYIGLHIVGPNVREFF